MEVENDAVSSEDLEKVIILDCGSQYGKVIDRKIRALNVESDLFPSDTPASVIKQNQYRGIIISGGPNSVYCDDAPDFDPEIFKLGLPILGICYGMQLINKVFGGEVTNPGFREDGVHDVNLDTKCPLFKYVSSPQPVLLTHADKVQRVACSFEVIATSQDAVVGIGNEKYKIYGLLFHPEVDLSQCGQDMFKAFLYDIVGVSGSYRLEDRETMCLEYIRDAVGDKKVLMLLSGGVDSTVCAALLHKALGPKNIVAVHINNGYMRKHETQEVQQALDDLGLDGVTVIDAKFKFMYGMTVVPIRKSEPDRTRYTKILCKISDPEEKRKIIGDVFVKVAHEFLREMEIDFDDVLLAQGTLRPDLIESASSLVSLKADTIKTHHNDTNLIRKLRDSGRIVEPLRNFHKDEVRLLGKKLGIPPEILNRHPFPGPGLAIRVLCGEEPYIERDFSETQVLVRIILDFDAMVKKKHALLHRIENITGVAERERLSQMSLNHTLAGTVLPIRTVGVQGDQRTYSYAVGISSKVEPTTREDWDDLFYYATIILRICPTVNRICYISGGLIGDLVNDITPTYLTSITLSTLRQADDVANQILIKNNCQHLISQMPIILIPIHFDRDVALRIPSVRRSVVVRPFVTMDFMTGLAARPGVHLPLEVVTEMLTQLRELFGISRSLYDMTNKPPATIEWE